MRKPTERAERWIKVEALCRCAELERQHGAAMSQRLDHLDDDKRVIEQMRRLCRSRFRGSQFSAFGRSFRRRLAALVALLRDVSQDTGRCTADALRG